MSSLILYEYTATSNQTTFSGSDDNSATLSYTVDNLQVVMNGIVLDPSDFTATNGTSVVLSAGAATGDLVNIYAFKSFTTADMVSKTNGGAFAGNVDFGAGIDVTGNATFADNGKAIFGAGSDLQIYHDGFNSYVSDHGGTGSLRLGSDGTVQIAKATGFGELMAQFTADGGCELRHDNTPVLNTTATGADITGVLTSDGLTVEVDGTHIYLKQTNGDFGHQFRQANDGGALQIGRNVSGTFTERMRVFAGGAVTVSGDADESPYNNSGNDPATVLNAFNAGLFSCARHNGDPAAFNRMGSDGAIVTFYQDGTAEGSINVSGSTVSLIGGHLCRWSQTSDGSKDTGIVRGTVMTNLNEMCEWKQVSFDYVITDDEGNETTIPKKTGYGGDADVGQTVTVQFEGSDVTGTVVAEDNEQLNRMAVSSVEGDVNVAGVMDSWDEDDDNYDDMTIAMTGDFVIRIAQGTTVTQGDLLMSAGDGTAKPQDDDIVRSKTIAKVTSTTVSHTYDDGTFLVPCVLMAC